MRGEFDKVCRKILILRHNIAKNSYKCYNMYSY